MVIKPIMLLPAVRCLSSDVLNEQSRKEQLKKLIWGAVVEIYQPVRPMFNPDPDWNLPQSSLA